MEENEPSEPAPADPWEEEIDLRELMVDIAKKWYLWIGLPLLVVLAVGIYYWTAPDRYQVREGAVLKLPAQ